MREKSKTPTDSKGGKMTEKLKELIDLISTSRQTQTIRKALDEIQLSLNDMKPFVYFEKRKYTRNLIHATPEFELVSLCWMPGHETPIHDHNGSFGFMTVIDGHLRETLYKPDEENKKLEIIGEEKAGPGQTTFIDDSVGYHKITNDSKNSAISLHFYAKPIESYFVYNTLNLERCKRSSCFYSKFGDLLSSQP